MQSFYLIVTFIKGAAVFIALHRYEEAFTDAVRAHQADPKYYKALVRQAVALQELGNFPEAMHAANAALELMPDSADLITLRKSIEDDIELENRLPRGII